MDLHTCTLNLLLLYVLFVCLFFLFFCLFCFFFYSYSSLLSAPPQLHRDAKSFNSLMASVSEDDEVMTKIMDFGAAVSAVSACGRVVDNPVWLAPEVGWLVGSSRSGGSG